MRASIVTSALANQVARYTNEHIQERSGIYASIVISALAGHRIARNMNERRSEAVYMQTL